MFGLGSCSHTEIVISSAAFLSSPSSNNFLTAISWNCEKFKAVLLRYLAIDYVVSEKKDDLQHERKTLRYLAIIKALVYYIRVR